MAKKKSPAVTRKQQARLAKADQQQKVLMLAGGLVIVLVVVIIGFGLYQENFARFRAPVAVVNGVPITTGAYQKMVRFRRFVLISYFGNLGSLNQSGTQDFLTQYLRVDLPEQVLNDMISDALLRQAAGRDGVAVSAEEIEARVRERFQPAEEPPSTSDVVTATVPTATQVSFEERYRSYLEQLKAGSGFSEADYRRTIETEVLAEKMRERLRAEVPSTEEQVHARHILVETEEAAADVLLRLGTGEDFAALAQELSTDLSTRDSGGDMGWFPRGEYDPLFDEVVFKMEVGQVGSIVQAADGYHVVEVVEPVQMRELDSNRLEQRLDQRFNEWLQELREVGSGVQTFWSPDKVPPLEEADGSPG